MLLLCLGTGPVLAKPITVNLTAHVTALTDYTGYLSGQVQLGQVITATYTYDTDTPALGSGHYPLAVPPGSTTVTAGALTFTSLGTSPVTVNVLPGSSLQIYSTQDNTLPDGRLIDTIMFNFADGTGQSPPSAALPVDAPNVQSYAVSHQIRVSGPFNSAYFELVADVDSAVLAPPSIEVSPAAGTFLPLQRFDAAVLLPPESQIASVRGSPVALSYPGTCYPVPPNTSGQPAILCPDARLALMSQQGLTQIDWQVVLTDGTTLNQSVQWKLIQ